ncbi:ferredoxin, partial [Thermodesulfobacteriota bacterium]
MKPDNQQMAHLDIKQAFEALYRTARQTMDDLADASTPKIHIGMATCGLAAGAAETKTAFEEALAEQSVTAVIHPVGCLGHCYAEPLVIIDHPESEFPPILYHEVSPGKAKMLV